VRVLSVRGDYICVERLVLEPGKGLIVEIVHDGISSAAFKGRTKRHVGPFAYEPGKWASPLIMSVGGFIGISWLLGFSRYAVPVLTGYNVPSFVVFLVLIAALLSPLLAAAYILDKAPHLHRSERAYLKDTWN
jgi:hypothetical protein